MESILYLLINALTFGVVLALSFDKKVHFHTSFPALGKAISTVAVPFLIWDVIFTHYEIWGFNERYLLGISIVGLPLEEILFFFSIPFACVFIYECTRVYYGSSRKSWIYRVVSIMFFLLVSPMAWIHFNDHYTAWAFGLGAATLLFLAYFNPPWTGQFYVSFFICLLPFIAVNSLLTGSWIEEEVVWYNNLETQGVRWGTIPMEDFLYCFLLLFWNVFVFERNREKESIPSSSNSSS